MLKGSPGYSNKKNQNASWTDRVLLRSRPRLRSFVEQTSYRAEFGLTQVQRSSLLCPFAVQCDIRYSCFAVCLFGWQSDHRPVCATWRLKVLPPYINTDALGGNAAAVRVHIGFPLLRYSDIVSV